MIALSAKNKVSYDALESMVDYSYRPANAGNRWQNIQHKPLVDMLVDEMQRNRFEIVDQQFAVGGKDNTELYAAFNLTIPGHDAPEGMTYSMGLRHSTAMKFAITMSAGARVFICENGMMTGEFVLGRKHTTGINLREELRRGVQNYVAEIDKTQSVIDGLKARALTRAWSNGIMMQAGRTGVLPFSHIGMVDAEYRNPSPDNPEAEGNTGWSLYNAFTYVIKKSSPAHQLDALRDARALIELAPVAA